ncbi:MAG: FHA domain-containing protein [Bdellovibrionales bacterium]|nr:FHA domain-containing protein [Bdellovibrionales bacterium]
MHRLVIVAGPNRGSSFALVDGDNSIGRQIDNHIVLTSVKVSKRHCTVSVNHEDVILTDAGSTNGVFVNGALVKKHILRPGDRVSVGDFVLELIRVSYMTGAAPSQNAQQMPMIQSHGQVYPMSQIGGGALTENTNPGLEVPKNALEAPDDPVGKIQFAFENRFMPIFYGMLLKTEFRSLVGALMVGVVTLSVVGSIMPMQDLAMKSIQREGLIRAKVVAREIADRFLPALANHAESQIDLSLIENEESIKMAAITNTSLQIIAPQSRINQLLAGGKEAIFANYMAKEFKEGRERGSGLIIGDTVAVYVEPIKVTDPRQVKTTVPAMVVVAVDFSNNLMATGEMGVTYGVGFVIAGIAAFLAYLIILRLSFKPYEVLNDDLDQVLRGELPRVTHEFKIEETAALWNNINAAIQRIPRLGVGGDSASTGETINVDWDMELAAVRALSEASGFGMIGFDQNLTVQALNPQFEEISGMGINAIGQTVNQAARDQAFVALVNDLMERVLGSPSRSALDVFEFSGLNYQVVATGVGPASQSGLSLVFKKKE